MEHTINIKEYKNALRQKFKERRRTMTVKRKTDIGGCLARYAAQVSSADKGAVINRFKG